MTSARYVHAFPPEMNIVEEIIAARKSLGLTIAEASRRAGIPRPNWSSIESGRRQPGLDILSRMADAVDLELEVRLIPKKSGKSSRKSA